MSSAEHRRQSPDAGQGSERRPPAPGSRPASPSRLRRRTAGAFLTGLLAAALGWGSWHLARNAPDEAGVSAPFRRVLEWNGRLWGTLFDRDHVAPPPRARRLQDPSTQARVNGTIGLDSEIDLAKWRLTVDVPGQAPRELTMAEIRALPRTHSVAEFHCIEGWSEAWDYAGVRFSDLLRYLGYRLPEKGASAAASGLLPYVGLRTPDGEYYVSVDTESMLHPQTLLAYELNGAPLEPEHGAPLRLIIPVKYGIKSLKRVGTIFLSESRPPDYWAEQGYDWFAGL